MKENRTNHYFSEWWERAVRRLLSHESHFHMRMYFRYLGLISGNYVAGESCTIPVPEYLKRWEADNPRPKMSRDEFIVALAKRVEALEAAIAEKGGKL